MVNNKKIYPEINLIKAVCALGIIVFHISCHTASGIKPFYETKNGQWGQVFVTAFFVVSGFLLYSNHPIITNLKTFYYKRAKNIFIPFWLLFAYYYIENVFQYGQIFYKGRPWSLILSLLGMDGYFLYRVDNYYIIGEWFLGAIILLYILYPLLLQILNKFEYIFLIIIFALYVFEVQSGVFRIHTFTNLFSCILSFYIGMLFCKHNKPLKSNIILIVSLILFAVCIFIPLPFDIDYSLHIMGISLFILLFRAGKYICAPDILNKTWTLLGNLSYNIFLLQHVIIIKMLNLFMPISLKKLLFTIVVTIVLIVVYALALSGVVRALTNSPLYRKIEGIILKEIK